jgi:hypothetical protein
VLLHEGFCICGFCCGKNVDNAAREIHKPGKGMERAALQAVFAVTSHAFSVT